MKVAWPPTKKTLPYWLFTLATLVFVSSFLGSYSSSLLTFLAGDALLNEIKSATDDVRLLHGEYQLAPTDELEAQIASTARERARLIQNFLQQNPTASSKISLLDGERDALPESAKEYIEEFDTVQGIYYVGIAEDFVNLPIVSASLSVANGGTSILFPEESPGISGENATENTNLANFGKAPPTLEEVSITKTYALYLASGSFDFYSIEAGSTKAFQGMKLGNIFFNARAQ